MSPVPDALLNLEDCFSGQPGDDGFLVPRERMDEWLRGIAASSDRVHIESIGKSTEGRDMLLVSISSPDTIRDLDTARRERSALADASQLVDPANADGRLAGDKPVVLITAGIHATEVGGVQLMPELIATLASSNDERILRILDQVIVLLVPTLNPDGMDLVHDWYHSTLGTSAEGTEPPELYHRYAGHDNNRDWYTHALVETRNVIDRVHNVWYPTIVLDLHEMGEHTARYFLPPYTEPAEPHVHPLIQSLSRSLGSFVATEHHRRGHRGVVTGALFDNYSPTRAYQTYHGGVRILAEAASARIASPAVVDRAQLIIRRGLDPRVPGVRNPLPWDGGTWRLRDIMDYHLTTIHALLDHAARFADDWLRDQSSILASDASRTDAPTYAISPLRQQIDPAAAVELVNTLLRGGVQLDIVDKPDEALQKGTLLVRTAQPFGSYARALLDVTVYPEMTYSPYDVTSHCLPIHMGVEVVRDPSAAHVATRPLCPDDLRVFPRPTTTDTGRTSWLAIDPRSHASIRLVTHALRNGASVHRLLRPHFDSGRIMQPGTWLIADDHALEVMSLASDRTIRTWLVRPIERSTTVVHLPSIGLYIPWSGEAHDTGWLRLMLEQSGIPYEVIRDEHIRRGELDPFDVILFAHLPPAQLLEGNAEGTYPPPYTGGIGNAGMLRLGAWTAAGGTIIAMGGALQAMASGLDLPIRFPLASLGPDEYSCPGAVISIEPDPRHPLMLGIDEAFPAMLEGKHALGRRSPHSDAPFAARFGHTPTLLSGWMRGADLIPHLGAIADITVGQGSVIGFAFRPHFRTQMLASYAPLVNAIMGAGYITDGENTE